MFACLRLILLSRPILFGGALVRGVAKVPTAVAHAILVQAAPAANSTLQEPPRELTLYFSEPLERDFSFVKVVDQDGQRLDQNAVCDGADLTSMRVAIRPAEAGYLIVSSEIMSVVGATESPPITLLNSHR